MKNTLLIILLFIPFIVSAQHVSGKIVDAQTGMAIETASIQTSSGSTITNKLGEFELTTNSDTLSVSHLAYTSLKIVVTGEFINIKLEPKTITLDPVIVKPYALIQGVINKYLGIYSSGNYNPKKTTFYYRQTTSQDNMHTEFIECFFNGFSAQSIYGLTLSKGRYARINNTDSTTVIPFSNAYTFSRYSPILLENKLNKNSIISPLSPGGSQIFDIKLASIIDENTDSEVYVYRFTPKDDQKKKYKTILGGDLHINTKDSTITKFECKTDIVDIYSKRAKVLSKNLNFIISYKYDVPFPIVESVKVDFSYQVKHLGKVSAIKINTIMYATDYYVDFNETNDYMDGNLLKKIDEHEYDPRFWEKNLIIKRTSVEDRVIEDFNRLGYFGNFKL